jgi:CheY-like chemotaxis protein
VTIVDPIVLLVDESENDALLMRIAFQRSGFGKPLQWARSGEQAIAYLLGSSGYEDRTEFPSPALVLLDLNMPRINGFEVLGRIRQEPALRRLLVFILTASDRTEDIIRAFDLGANAYLVKPPSLDELIRTAQCLRAWLAVSQCAPPPTADRRAFFALAEA